MYNIYRMYFALCLEAWKAPLSKSMGPAFPQCMENKVDYVSGLHCSATTVT
jgi:hypothetical protein